MKGGMADKPHGFSALPGSMEKEDQTVKTPLGSNSHVLVVGASRGLGLEFCEKLLAKGCRVVATHRGEHVPEALSALASSSGDKLQFLCMDVGDEQSIIEAAATLKGMLEKMESPGLSHIIHNAGIYGPRDSLDGKSRLGRAANPPVTKQGMLQTFEINTIGPLLMAQSFTPLMKKPAEGKKGMPILAILSSKVGSVDDNGSGGAYAYRASKSALNIVAKSLFCDLWGSVAVFLLHPGYVRTDMTNGQGLIDTDESVDGMLRAIEATDGETPFRWVDYKACRIPW